MVRNFFSNDFYCKLLIFVFRFQVQQNLVIVSIYSFPISFLNIQSFQYLLLIIINHLVILWESIRFHIGRNIFITFYHRLGYFL